MSEGTGENGFTPGFAAGLAARCDAGAAARLGAMQGGFAPIDLAGSAASDPVPESVGFEPRPRGFAAQSASPKSFKPEAAKPKHFKPAEAEDKPEAWDPRDADSGFVDPIARARAEGFAEGVAHAEALRTGDEDRDATLVAGIAAALASPERIDRERLAQQLREAVVLLARKLVGETGVAADRLAGRIVAAADMIADTAEAAVLRVHPEDAALLKEHLPPTLCPVADAAVARGHFVLESAATIVEEGPELWLEQLSAAIERVPLPSC